MARAPSEEIAIIGVAGRYPQAQDLDQFWENLKAGRDCVSEIPADRWNPSLHPQHRWGGFLDAIDRFDATFFNISPREAERMDPQERIFLEVAWQTLEDAGYTRRSLQLTGSEDLPGNVGVFVGVTYQEYQLYGAEQQARGKATGLSGISAGVANRVSYFCNFHGPSVAVDTMCSSSLTAVHLACQSLHADECELALAGGVNLSLHRNKYVILSQGQFFSTRGRCESFGANGDGYVPGEGVGCILLKPLSKAIRDRDRICGIIKATALNHGGKTNGYTVPNPNAQAAVIARALAQARIDASSISYIEAHGTGTPLGDPIEIAGLSKAYQSIAPQQCAIGSVKSNIGHCEAAAGIAGLTKVLLQMRHAQIAPSLHAVELNPNIDFSKTPFAVQRTLSDWLPYTGKRIAGISSFGAGGSNAHIIVEEGPAADETVATEEPILIVLSAQNAERLHESASRLRNHLSAPLSDVAHTLQIGREAMEHRVAFVTRESRDLAAKIDAWMGGASGVDGVFAGSGPRERPTRGVPQPDLAVMQQREEALRNRRLDDLARLWVGGAHIDWTQLEACSTSRRVSLPAYPFDRSQRYWFDSYDHKPAPGRAILPTILPVELSVVSCRLIDNSIALVKMEDREHRNQMASVMVEELEHVFTAIAADPRVKVAVLTGYDEVFSMGGTKEALVGISEGKLRYSDVPFVYRGLLDCPVPVIAAMEGHAVGGGLAFGCQADIVFLAEESVYCANFMQYGFTPGMGATLFFKEKFGANLANELMFTADSLTGSTLRDKGAPIAIKPRVEVLAEAMAKARSLSEKPPDALKLLKRTLSKRILDILPAVVDEELAMHDETITRPEVRQKIEDRIDRMESLSAPVQPASRTPAAGSEATADATTIEDRICGMLAGLLHMNEAKVRSESVFQDLGVDSIIAVELARDVNTAYGLNLDAVVLYDCPTVGKYARHVAEQLGKLQRSIESARVAAPRAVAPMPGPSRKLVLDSPSPMPSVPPQPAEKPKIQLSAAALGETALGETAPRPVESPRADTQPAASSKTRPAVAVIGIAGQFPGAKNLDAFWRNLMAGVCSVQEVPASRWSLDEIYDPDFKQPNKTYSRWGGFLDAIDRFDPLFFNISPAEAEQMDPQQRLFLQTAWHALEDAGYAAEQLAGTSCGVFVGVGQGDYLNVLNSANKVPSAQSLMGNTCSMLSARIAYLLDLTGPNMAIDTACSSSLVAIHQACRSILSGESEMTLAGGVYAMTTPAMHIMTSRGAMLSPTGQCRAFDQEADGFVLAEGVGVLVLKALDRAIRDSDHIYGVIRGSGVNYDGATNGITAPSAVSQERLERDVYERSGVSPDVIGLVEAHGTGTKLGDPIELKALTNAFRAGTAKTGYCAIGSVKSNIGHALAAAGIAGAIKTLLCLEHRKLVPTLHFDRLNEHIDLESSPFYVNTECRDWELPAGQSSRFAALSSFGLSGTNAHLVFEEYLPTAAPDADTRAYHLFTLSAKTDDALQARLLDLAEWVDRNGTAERINNIADVAFTLNRGRSHFTRRCALVVSSLNEAAEAARAALVGKTPENVLFGHDGAAAPADRAVFRELASHLANSLRTLDRASADARDKLIALGRLYTMGIAMNWDALRGDAPARRISLPGYPFAEERCWPTAAAGTPESAPESAAARLHPLLGANQSDLFEQKFTTTFTGSESYLAHHRVGGERLLPAIAILEMARAAASLAGRQTVARIHDIAWTRPIAIQDSPANVSIHLTPDGDSLSFEVRQDGKPCSRGAVDFRPRKAAPPQLDLSAIQSRCVQQKTGTECYALFARMGIEYGPSFQTIQTLWFRDGEALAELKAAGNADDVWLNPGMLDGALQAGLGLVSGGDASSLTAAVPYALAEMILHGRTCDRMFAHVTRSASGAYNITVTDADGHSRVELHDLVSRPIARRESAVRESAVWTLARRWVAEAPTATVTGGSGISSRTIVFSPSCEEIAATLAAKNVATDLLPLPDEHESAIVTLFGHIRDVLQKTDLHAHQYVVLHGPTDDACRFAALAGMLKTAARENPAVQAKVIHYPADFTLDRIQQEMGAPTAGVVELRWSTSGVREVRRFVDAPLSIEAAKPPFRDGAVYWITGGTGGLGLLTARHIAASARARIILSSRGVANDSVHDFLKELEKTGSEAMYLPCDVASQESVQTAVDTIHKRFGPLNGVIHSAGVIRDAFILKKEERHVREVLAPKITGILNLDRATASEPLDFLILYSAAAGSLGNLGQCDYSAANAFLDAFAESRPGRVVSLGWPLWAEGGMTVDADTEKMMRSATGAEAIPTATAMRVLDASCAASLQHFLVLYGDREKLRRTLIDSPVLTETVTPAATGEISEADVIGYLKNQLSIPLKLSANRIDAGQSFEEYGIDSVMVLEVTAQLERDWGPLPKTLFFEHANVRALARHFLTAYPDRMKVILSASPVLPTAIPAEPIPDEPTKLYHLSAPQPTASIVAGTLDIAIVGLSGRYPKAPNIEAFWRNLRYGIDCISEIPRDRWNHDPYYDPQKNGDGKVRSKWGGFLDDIDKFDPYFFKISPLEAAVMDPQERLFLETAWETLEDAGYTRDLQARRAVGVYVGVMYSEYQLYGAEEQAQGRPVALSGSAASVANRVSYFLNLRGPSITVDSMCSSSLTAIHLACQSLRSGDIEMALAGGVNLSLHPNKYLLLGQGQFISSKGRCESFGAGGDGYVPGEGVGCVLLKPLARAEAEGDHIYGIIRGTALNHGGKTNGYTVPNPSAQQEVIEAALRQARVSPRDISYVEAHGTGTLLGDPIEIDGLTKAFHAGTTERGFCAIGSVKSNIGHCESAAGIAGLTKVLLQMKHRQLVPSLHSETRNPHINFECTPFLVQQQLAEWTRSPRIAGLSSFGAGGSNAHVVVEEWQGAEAVRDPDLPQLIVLSARTSDQLRQAALNLLRHLADGADGQPLSSIAYTLQVGREVMEHRLAFVAATLPDVITQLRQWLDHRTVECSGHSGLESVAELWRSGQAHDWTSFHPQGTPRRVSLPTYPFARERCWFRDEPAPLSRTELDRTEWIVEHHFSGTEDWLSGHRIHGEVVLPGVAYLDFVFEAARPLAAAKHLSLSDVVWVQPLVVNQPQTLRITLKRRQGDFDFEAAGDSGAVYCRGSLAVADASSRDEHVDIERLKSSLRMFDDADVFYRKFASVGIDYGASYRSVRKLWCDNGRSLGWIKAQQDEAERRGCILYPPLADAVLQVIAGIPQAHGARTPLPFSLGLVKLADVLPSSFYVLAQRTPLGHYDIQLIRPDGLVLGRFDRLDVRATADPLSGLTYELQWRSVPLPDHATTCVAIQSARTLVGRTLVIYGNHSFGLERAVLDYEGHDHAISMKAADVDSIRNLPELAKVYFLGGLDDRPGDPSDPARIEEGHRSSTLTWFRCVKDLLARERDLEIVVVTQQMHDAPGTTAVEPISAGLHGLCHSLSREAPQWKITVVDIDRASLESESQRSDLVERIAREPRQSFLSVAYRGPHRYLPAIAPITLPDALPQSSIREGGTYVIAGGAGGIGFTISDLLARNYRARVVWLGRRPLNEDIRQKAATLECYGAAPLYLQADITDWRQMREALDRVKRETGGGAIHGVIHSALSLHDRSLRHMSEEEFEATARTKIHGSVVLAETFGREAEDWFCFFSSAQSLIGGAGQANYAAGSSFTDTYAAALRQRLDCAVHTIDWGFWGEVGAVATGKYRERMARQGLGSISRVEGVEAFLRTLSHKIERLVVLKTSEELKARLLGALTAPLHLLPQVLSDDWDAILSRVPARPINRRVAEIGNATYGTLDDLARQGLILALDGMGLRSMLETPRPPDDLQSALGILPKYTLLFKSLLQILVESGVLERHPNEFSLRRDRHSDPVSLVESFNRLLRQSPGFSDQILLLQRCLASLPDVLAGRRTAEDILFAGSSVEHVSGVYAGNEVSDHFNHRVADVVEACCAERLTSSDAGRKFRVLEAGAGTGSTSAFILDRLAPFGGNVEYVYTDISAVFLEHGRKRFQAPRATLSFAHLDLEHDCASQGFEPGSFDVVVAANVLHATASITNTLTNVKRALKRNGVLVFDELSAARPFLTLTFGLMTGWWLSHDLDIRIPGSPGVSPHTWPLLLAETGFNRSTLVTPESVPFGRFIFMAHSDGRIASAGAQLAMPQVLSRPPEPVRLGSAADWLKRLLADALKMPEDRIAATARFETLGVDSIIAVVLTDRLEEAFGRLPRTLLFEYQTLEQLTAYFEEHHSARLRELSGEDQKGQDTPAPAAAQAPAIHSVAVLDSDIAIIGIGGRYPGALRLNAFWSNLRNGVDSICEILADRWDADRYYDPNPQPAEGKARNKWGGFIDDVDKFDPLFFRIAPAEAELLDPQERLFLQTVWETLESAGYPPRRLAALQEESGRGIGVFVGAMYQLYPWVAQQPITSAVSYWSIANRVSYFFDFHGPSIAIDTACSSSTVAIHMACESIRRGDAVCAIAGGVNLSLHPLKYLALQGTGMLSSGKASRCLGRGDGFVPGEGVGAVLLKPLALAERDRDRILGVIKGSRVHHSGQGNGYRVPNPNMQAESIARLFQETAIDPETIGYVEVAANGIPLSDSIEVAALSKAFRRFTNRRQFCPIGSVKSNIGHLEAASGISQLTKVLLQLAHSELAPTLHTDPLNPAIDLEATPFYIQRDRATWPNGNHPRRALINSLGAGGTNAHLLVEEYPARASESPRLRHNGPVLVLFSARNDGSLFQYARDLYDFLRRPDAAGISLPDLAYTLQVGREPMEERIAIVASSIDELTLRLGTLVSGNTHDPAVYRGTAQLQGSAGALIEGAAGKAFVDRLIREHDLARLAHLWASGAEIDWGLLYGDELPARIDLPTYAFTRRRCWITPGLTSPNWISSETSSPAATTPVPAPDGGFVETLKEIVAGVLKIDPRELHEDRALKLYGVDSILSTVIMEIVRERFGASLSLAAILEFPTLRELASHLSSAAASQSHDTTTAEYLPELIPIQPRGSKPASFWVHGLVGFAHLYKRLAFGLGPDYPIYGLQARGIDGRQPPFTDVESMAAHYVSCIRKVQPHGPYYVGGYSSGGLFALEIARQLAAVGEKVGRVFLLDTYPHNEATTRTMEKNMDYAMRSVMTANLFLVGEENTVSCIDIEELDGVAPDQHVSHLLKLIEARSVTSLPSDQIYRMLRGSIDVANCTGAAFKTYQPPIYHASDVVFFQATGKFIDEGNVLGLPVTELDSGNREQAWREQIDSRLDVVNIACDHFGLIEEPHLRVVCRDIAGHLDSDRSPQAPAIAHRDRSSSEAIVVGGGIAGLLTARILSGHFERVTVLERDRLSDDAAPRRGIPQGNHLHSLLKGGLNVLCDFFPGFDRDLAERGSVAFQAGFDLLQEDELGTWPQREFGIRQYFQSRPLLESSIRRRLLEIENVRIENPIDAGELLWSPDGSRVLGIRVKDGDGRVSDRFAALTVNATGRRQTILHELQEKGWPAPDEIRIPVDLAYSTCLFEVPADSSRTWKGVFSYSSGADEGTSRRGGSILPIERNRWIVTLGGRHGNYPPTDMAGFLEYARRLPTPTVYDAIRHARPISAAIEHFRVPHSVLRHFDRMGKVPQRLLHVGDVICSFDPVFGQGMASAALQVMALGNLLSERKGLTDWLDGLEQAFFRKAAHIVQTPWNLAAKSHFEAGAAETGDQREYEQFLMLSRRAMADVGIHRVLVEVFQLVRLYEELRAEQGVSTLTRPALAGD